jgi:hypothetical protein
MAQAFSTDRVGEAFLAGPPLKFVLTRTPQDLSPAVREFAGCDIHMQSLWLLDQTTWDFKKSLTVAISEFEFPLSGGKTLPVGNGASAPLESLGSATF